MRVYFTVALCLVASSGTWFMERAFSDAIEDWHFIPVSFLHFSAMYPLCALKLSGTIAILLLCAVKRNGSHFRQAVLTRYQETIIWSGGRLPWVHMDLYDFQWQEYKRMGFLGVSSSAWTLLHHYSHVENVEKSIMSRHLGFEQIIAGNTEVEGQERFQALDFKTFCRMCKNEVSLEIIYSLHNHAMPGTWIAAMSLTWAQPRKWTSLRYFTAS